jgi:hypothetical protein
MSGPRAGDALSRHQVGIGVSFVRYAQPLPNPRDSWDGRRLDFCFQSIQIAVPRRASCSLLPLTFSVFACHPIPVTST